MNGLSVVVECSRCDATETVEADFNDTVIELVPFGWTEARVNNGLDRAMRCPEHGDNP